MLSSLEYAARALPGLGTCSDMKRPIGRGGNFQVHLDPNGLHAKLAQQILGNGCEPDLGDDT